MRHRPHPRSGHRARSRGGGHRPARVSEGYGIGSDRGCAPTRRKPAQNGGTHSVCRDLRSVTAPKHGPHVAEVDHAEAARCRERSLRPRRIRLGIGDEAARPDGVRDGLRLDGLRLHRPAGRSGHVPVPEVGVGVVGHAVGRARVRRRPHRCRGCVPDRAVGRSLEQGESHRRDGSDLEPRHARLRLRAELRAAVHRPCGSRCGRGRVRPGGGRAALHGVPREQTGHGARRVPGRCAAGHPARPRARRDLRRAVGMAGRIRRGRGARPDPRARVPAATGLPNGADHPRCRGCRTPADHPRGGFSAPGPVLRPSQAERCS